jgi:hypothetical protein
MCVTLKKKEFAGVQKAKLGVSENIFFLNHNTKKNEKFSRVLTVKQHATSWWVRSKGSVHFFGDRSAFVLEKHSQYGSFCQSNRDLLSLKLIQYDSASDWKKKLKNAVILISLFQFYC